MVRMGGPVRVFISYSHDSPDHAKRIRELSDKLRNEGVDCHLDQYEMFPTEGWPAWMQRQIHDADFVLCVASEAYHRRVTGREAVGIGAGAKWEGAIITQRLYEAEGRNEKFIPVYFGQAAVPYIPPFLAGFTRYDLSSSTDYERLYRLITNQPAVIPPPIGSIRQLTTDLSTGSVSAQPTAATIDYSSLALILAPDLGMHFVDADELVVGDTIELAARPFNSEGGNFLESLRKARKPLGISHGLQSFQAQVSDVRQTVRGGTQTFHLKLQPEQSNYGAGLLEMSVQGLSADRIAELRARRILLDERLETNRSSDIAMLNDSMVEVFVRGISAPLSVEESPLPDLFEEVGADPAFFVAGARLVSMLWLRLSGTVETVSKLEMNLVGTDSLAVDFTGFRGRKYVNAEPTKLSVRGHCQLVRRTE